MQTFFVWRLLPYATIALLAAPLLGHWFGESVFFFDLLSNFPVQYAGVAGILLAFWLGRGRWGLTAVSLLALLLNGFYCGWLFEQAPSLPAAGRQPDLRVFHANVLYTRSNYGPIVDTIRRLNPDFFVLQEMTPAGVRAVAALRRDYPYQDSIWAKGPCYILVGSRTPFTVDSAARRSHRVIALTSTVRGRVVSLLTVHPRTPLLPHWFRERNRQLRYVAGRLATAQRPTVLIGDFNISPFSPIYRRNFGKNATDSSRIRSGRNGFGWTPTWPRYFPIFYLPIDHAFTNPGFHAVNFRTLPTPGSDHRAICVDLIYR